MAKKADRYTVQVCHTNDLPKVFEAINALQMHWFCVKSSTSPRECDVYIFFDKAGLDNYLNGVYGAVEDDTRRHILQVKEGEITADEAVSLIEDMLAW